MNSSPYLPFIKLLLKDPNDPKAKVPEWMDIALGDYFCRFADDCDLRACVTSDGQFVIDVAAFQSDGKTPIGLPFDGEMIIVSNIGMTYRRVLALHGLGYKVPPLVLDALAEACSTPT